MKNTCFYIGGVNIYKKNYDFALEGWTSIAQSIVFSMRIC